MVTLQHVWQGFCDGIWTIAFLLLNPFVSILLLLAFVVIAICLRGSRDGFGKTTLCLVVLLASYTVFNIADYCIYRYCGALSISPINQGFFQLFCHPDDLYEPYAKVELSPEITEYEVEFTHKYGGKEEVAICIPDGERWINQYDECMSFTVTAKGVLTSEDGERTEIDDIANVKAFAPSKLSFEILCYRIENRLDCRKRYKLKIKFGGNYSEMVKYYAGVCLVAGNATTK